MYLHSIILTEENRQNKANHEDQNILEGVLLYSP